MDRVWEKSGHWENYRDNMFTTESENCDFGGQTNELPGHVQIFQSGSESYRDLPLRLSEFGSCHRNEPSGSLHGIMRAYAALPRTTRIFSVPRPRYRMKHRSSSICCRWCTVILALTRCWSNCRPVRRNAPVPTRGLGQG